MLNTLLVSIPEETFLVMFILILLGKLNFLGNDILEKRINRTEIIKISTPIILTAIMSNVLRYLGIDFNIVFLSFLIALFILLTIIFELWKDGKEIGKALLFLMFGVLIMLVLEFSYIPFILYATEKTVEELNSNLLWNFLISLPERTIEGLLIAFLLSKKFTFLKASIIKPITQSRFLVSITITTLIFDIALMAIMIKSICYDKILINLSLSTQIVIIVGNILFPIINVAALLCGVYHKENQTQAKQAFFIETMQEYIQNIKVCTNNSDYGKISSSLKAIELEVTSLSEL
jgi:hypothetical protein